jgi:Tol biopolymer transport system component/predicted Ser/Thr protein kinase
MSLKAGFRLGPYEILAPVGAGGMGEVYRARDTRLERIVALKILPAAFGKDKDRLRRFEQEARLLSALNHPSIVAIYDIGTQDGTPYLVSEFIEGLSLRQRLDAGPLSNRRAADYALQIARAMAAAHDRGVVHRDIKPENILIMQDGRVKLLDFGLAKEKDASMSVAIDAPTRTAAVQTQPGVVMGTVGYMSPEQVRGAQADYRTDIFSFGAVLYEMVSGRRAFQRDSAVETMNAILKEDPPDFTESPAGTSPGMERIIRRCLEKAPEQRFQSASDLAFAIEALSGTTSVSVAVAASGSVPRMHRLYLAMAVSVAIIAVAITLFAGWNSRRKSAPTFRQLVFGPGTIGSARFTPDGQNVVYGAAWRGKPFELFSTRIDSIESRPMGLPPADVAGISKTGEMLLLENWQSLFQWNMTGTLARATLSGGAPRPLLEHVCGGDIDSDGKQIAVVRCGGNIQTLEYPLGKAIYHTNGWIDHVRLAPDGTAVAFLDHPINGDDRGYVAWADALGKITRLSNDWSAMKSLAWNSQGSEIWFSGSRVGEQEQIWAVNRAEKRRLVYAGPADTLIQDVAANGRALLLQARQSNDIAVRRPGQKSDQIVDLVSETGSLAGISSDGSLMALSYVGVGSGADYLTYVVNTDTHEAVRIGDGDPSGISPDGKFVLSFFPSTPGKMTLYPTGPGETRTFQLGLLRNTGIFCSWTGDSLKVVFTGADGDKPSRGYLLDVATGTYRAITPEGTSNVMGSPDGKYAIGRSQSNGIQLFPIGGGTPMNAKGIAQDEETVQWNSDGSMVYVWDRQFPARISLVNPWTGERKPFLETMPPDPSGILYGNFFITPNGRTYAYRFRRLLTTLFLAEGLR